MKKLIKNLFLNKYIARLLLKPFLILDNKLYRLISILAIAKEGVHPKHNILSYKKWFIGQINQGDVVLDVGCNTGALPKALSEKASKVYGIEIEGDLVRRAKKINGAENIEYVHGDATTFDYGSIDKIDIVTLSNVLEHIEHRVDFLRDIVSSIRWNNEPKLAIRVPVRDREWLAIYKKELGIEWRLDTTHFTEYTEHEFREEMIQAGLRVTSLEVRFGEIYALCQKR